MHHMNDQEALDVLRRVGFAVSEINRLSLLRQDYRASKLNEAPLNHARLEFARWLVQTGRLTDQIAGEDVPCAIPVERISIIKTVINHLKLKVENYGKESRNPPFPGSPSSGAGTSNV